MAEPYNKHDQWWNQPMTEVEPVIVKSNLQRELRKLENPPTGDPGINLGYLNPLDENLLKYLFVGPEELERGVDARTGRPAAIKPPTRPIAAPPPPPAPVEDKKPTELPANFVEYGPPTPTSEPFGVKMVNKKPVFTNIGVDESVSTDSARQMLMDTQTEENSAGPFAIRKGPGAFSPGAEIPQVNSLDEFKALINNPNIPPGVKEVAKEHFAEISRARGLEAEIANMEAQAANLNRTPQDTAYQRSYGDQKATVDLIQEQVAAGLKAEEPAIEARALELARAINKKKFAENSPEFIQYLEAAKRKVVEDRAAKLKEEAMKTLAPKSYVGNMIPGMTY